MMRLETLTVQAANDSLTDKERAHLKLRLTGSSQISMTSLSGPAYITTNLF